MAETLRPIEIPKRPQFKAAEVCSLVDVKPYVLRSWEIEFPDLGEAKTAGGPRMYRRPDVERVIRIKHLLLVEGLTLAGARRRLEEEARPLLVEAPPVEPHLGQHARECLTEIKHGLRAILDLLAAQQASGDLTAPASMSSASSVKAALASPASGTARKSSTAVRQPARRKQSA